MKAAVAPQGTHLNNQIANTPWNKTQLKRLAVQILGPKWGAEADCIMRHESGYNPAALSPRNTNGTRDYGLMQINTIHTIQNSPRHPRFDLARAFDPVYNLEYTKTILIAQGNWSAWKTAPGCGL